MNPRPMTELLERAGETMRGLPAETQDALARILLELAGGTRRPRNSPQTMKGP
jgi:hypothetical protein